MMKKIQQILVSFAFVVAMVASAAETNDLTLSLRQRTDKGEVVLDILVSNVSTSAVEIVSESIAPPWSVWAWFQWEVDGKPAEYPENVAMIPNAKESWRIPRGGVILWATIPVRSLACLTDNDQGQKESRRAITDNKRHSITIMPGRQWQEGKRSLLDAISNGPPEQRTVLKVGSGRVDIGQEDTEPPAGGDGKSAPQPSRSTDKPIRHGE
jgi:hypothetical protein